MDPKWSQNGKLEGLLHGFEVYYTKSLQSFSSLEENSKFRFCNFKVSFLNEVTKTLRFQRNLVCLLPKVGTIVGSNFTEIQAVEIVVG